MNTQTSRIASPCIRICCLDNNDVCLGCFRHLKEITQWTQVDDSSRQQILTNASTRKKAYEQAELRFTNQQ